MNMLPHDKQVHDPDGSDVGDTTPKQPNAKLLALRMDLPLGDHNWGEDVGVGQA